MKTLLLKLAIVSAAVGARARIQTRLGGEAVTPSFNLALGSQDLPAVLSRVRDLLAPLAQAQKEWIQRRHTVGADVHGQLWRVQGELVALRASPYPDPGHIAALEAHILHLRQQTHVRLIVHNPKAGTLADCARGSFDESVLHVIDSQRRVDDFLNLSDGDHRDLELMGSAWSMTPYFPRGRGTDIDEPPIANPCITSIILTDEQRLRRLLRRSRSLRGNDLNCFWPVSDESHQPSSQQQPQDHVWSTLIRQLVSMRISPEPVVYELNPAARDALATGLKEAAHVDHRDSQDAELRILRITLALQLLGSPGCHQVHEPIVNQALDLYHRLMGERQRLLERAMSQGLDPTPENLQAMLQKVKRHQPIAPHRLRRLYDSERRPWLTPLIDRLLKDGRISKDVKGRLFVSDNPPPGVVKEVNYVVDGKVLKERPAA